MHSTVSLFTFESEIKNHYKNICYESGKNNLRSLTKKANSTANGILYLENLGMDYKSEIESCSSQ